MKRINFADTHVEEEDVKEVADVIRSGWFTQGARVKEFENEFARFIHAKHAVALSSCTAALHLSMRALEIGPGDEVLVPSLTFAASANCVLYVRARPIFCEVDPETYCIDPEDVKKRISTRTKAIVIVHYGGHSVNMDPILDIAMEHDLRIVEDAAHAPGTLYKGRPVGTLGDIGCFSFFSNKNLTTGEGGLIATNEKSLAEKCDLLRSHGIDKSTWERFKNLSWKYNIVELGYNYRMTEFGAALGLVQLKRLPEMNEKRKKLASTYFKQLEPLREYIQLPSIRPYSNHIFHLFVIQIIENSPVSRGTLSEILKNEHGISTSVHYIPLHLHPFYQKTLKTRNGDLPQTEKISKSILSLPMHPNLNEDDIIYVCEAIKSIFKH
ncbi:MAG: DegT/DnrJ/EryC1/StrS family aminotransferase [Candidatus Helarchaeota archaeon]